MSSDRPWMIIPCPHATKSNSDRCWNLACNYCGNEYVPPVSVEEADIIARAYCKKFIYLPNKYDSPESMMVHIEKDVTDTRNQILRGQSKWMVDIFKTGQQSVVNQFQGLVQRVKAKDPRSDLPYCAVCDLRHDLPMHKPCEEDSE